MAIFRTPDKFKNSNSEYSTASEYELDLSHGYEYNVPCAYSMAYPKNMYRYRWEGSPLSSSIEPTFALESRNKNYSTLSAEWWTTV